MSNSLRTFIGFTLYTFLFLWVYDNQISPFFSYMGLTNNELSFAEYSLCSFLSFIHLLYIPSGFQRPSNLFVWFFYFFLIHPLSFVMLKTTEFRNLNLYLALVFFHLNFFLLVNSLKVMSSRKILRLKLNMDIVPYVLPFLALILGVFLQYKNGFSFSLDPTTMYERRFNSRELLQIGGIITYLEVTLTGVLIPLLFFYGLLRKNRSLVIVSIVLVLSIFSLKGSKGVILSPFFFVVIFFLLKTKKRPFYKLLLLMNSLMILSIFEYLVNGTSILAALVIRRKLVVPSALTRMYYEYFNENPFVFMKDSILGKLIPLEPNYQIHRSRLIGLEYFGREEFNANVNIWAAAFADFGFTGVLITTFIAIYILRILDNQELRKKNIVIFAITAQIAIVWSEGAIYTSILSNGILVFIMFIIFQTNERTRINKW